MCPVFLQKKHLHSSFFLAWIGILPSPFGFLSLSWVTISALSTISWTNLLPLQHGHEFITWPFFVMCVMETMMGESSKWNAPKMTPLSQIFIDFNLVGMSLICMTCSCTPLVLVNFFDDNIPIKILTSALSSSKSASIASIKPLTLSLKYSRCVLVA